jgi:hypothetical protein
MRIKPRPLIALGIVAGYLAIVGITRALFGLNYTEMGGSTSTILQGIIIPILPGGVFLVIVTSYLGWWRPAIHEASRAPKWLWVAPVLIAVPGIVRMFTGAATSGRGPEYLAVLAIGTLIVGFNEELLYRGTGLVGLRGGFNEPIAWAISCLLFGVTHGLNVFTGQSIGATIQQVITSALIGTVFYIARRVSGTLILPMVLHAWVDFSILAFSDAANATGSPWLLLKNVEYVAYLLAIIGTVIVLRRKSTTGSETSGAPAAA